MKFVLLTEGELERKALPKFLKKWLDPRLQRPVQIDADIFQGVSELIRETPRRAQKYLHDSRQDVIAVIALFDFYGASLEFPPDKTTAQERQEWAKQHMENLVNLPKFRQFLAVHETEAWLLSQPDIFPLSLQADILKHAGRPEAVNMNEPPAELLKRLYLSRTKHKYHKVTNGTELFGNLNPVTAYDKCPNLKAMLDEMLRLAKEARH